MKRAWIISVGNEILEGRVVNTNLAWLGRRLTFLGFLVERAVAVRDDCEEIALTFSEAVARADLVVSTGGLGPTFDDMTVPCAARGLGLGVRLSEEALRMVREKYESAGLEMTEHRRKMAILPEGAKPLYNPVGTAPGVLLEVRGTLVVMLPGVPSEMKAIFEREVEPVLRSVGTPVYVAERVLTCRGVPESSAAPLIEMVMKRHARVYIKSHPSGSELGEPVLRIHLSASGDSPGEAESNVLSALNSLEELLREAGGEIEVSESWST